MSEASAEMPRYKCHKEVWALKIAGFRLDADAAAKEGRETDGSVTIIPADNGYAPFKVGHEFARKHLHGLAPDEIIGGYYVVYKDGYKSFSPAEAFEDGYTRV